MLVTDKYLPNAPRYDLRQGLLVINYLFTVEYSLDEVMLGAEITGRLGWGGEIYIRYTVTT